MLLWVGCACNRLPNGYYAFVCQARDYGTLVKHLENREAKRTIVGHRREAENFGLDSFTSARGKDEHPGPTRLAPQDSADGARNELRAPSGRAIDAQAKDASYYRVVAAAI